MESELPKLEDVKIKIWVQYGEDSLPRLGYTFENLAAWNAAKIQSGRFVKLEMLAEILALGEPYLPQEKVLPGQWPEEAIDLLREVQDVVNEFNGGGAPENLIDRLQDQVKKIHDNAVKEIQAHADPNRG